MDQGNEIAEPTETNTTTPSQTGDNAGRPGHGAEIIRNMSKMAALLQKMLERDAALHAHRIASR
jgi:hypothetical protein